MNGLGTQEFASNRRVWVVGVFGVFGTLGVFLFCFGVLVFVFVFSLASP
jgi:hypothetical protein